MGSYNCIAGCQDCDTSTGCCNDDWDQGLASGPNNCTTAYYSTGTTPASSTTGTPAATGSSLLSIFQGLAGLTGSIATAVSGPTTQASLSSTPTTAQPYPVTVNGKIVGYSSVPSAASTSAVAGVSGTDLVLFGLLALVVYWLATKK
jgi:hypothetical protein